MSRNVVRHVSRPHVYMRPRQLNILQRCLYASNEQSPNSAVLEVDEVAKLDGNSSEQMETFLRALDQRTLLDTKIKLGTIGSHVGDLHDSIPKLLNSEYEGAPTYIIGTHRAEIDKLDEAVKAFSARIDHTRNHIEDLQTEDYAEKGDGMAGWKEEVEKMTRQEKEKKVQDLKYREEAHLNRLREGAERNLELARDLHSNVVGKQRVEAKGDAKTGEEEQKESVFATFMVQKDKSASGPGASQKEEKSEAGSATLPGEEAKAEESLAELQKRLTEKVRGT